MKKYKPVHKRKRLGEEYILNQRKKTLLGKINVLIFQWIKETPLSGQDIMNKIQDQFNVKIGPGTMYPILYQLQNKSLIESKLYNKKKMYFLTKKGKTVSTKVKNDYLKTNKLILDFLKY